MRKHYEILRILAIGLLFSIIFLALFLLFGNLKKETKIKKYNRLINNLKTDGKIKEQLIILNKKKIKRIYTNIIMSENNSNAKKYLDEFIDLQNNEISEWGERLSQNTEGYNQLSEIRVNQYKLSHENYPNPYFDAVHSYLRYYNLPPYNKVKK